MGAGVFHVSLSRGGGSCHYISFFPRFCARLFFFAKSRTSSPFSFSRKSGRFSGFQFTFPFHSGFPFSRKSRRFSGFQFTFPSHSGFPFPRKSCRFSGFKFTFPSHSCFSFLRKSRRFSAFKFIFVRHSCFSVALEIWQISEIFVIPRVACTQD
jgi:hypothetical protein